MKEVSPDLVERLRGHLALQVSHPHFSIIANDCYAAADAIVTLQAELAKPACTDENGSWHNPDDLNAIATLQAGRGEVPCRHEWYQGTCVHCLRDAPTSAQRAELIALQAERDAEKLKRLQAEHERDCMLEDLAALHARCDGLERDARRLDWLDETGRQDGHGFCHVGYGYYRHYVYREYGGVTHESARQVIDTISAVKEDSRE